MKNLFLKPMAAMLACSLMATAFTACSEDDDDDTLEIAEQFNLDYLTAKANNDGTITISGTVTTNKALTKFELTPIDAEGNALVDENGKEIVYDLMTEAEKDKVETEDGKVWTATLSSDPIPVSLYKLEVRTRLSTTKTATVGKVYSFDAGTSKNADFGSYLSFSKRVNYLMSDLLSDDKKEATDALDNVEAILKDDKCADKNNPKIEELYIETIKRATNAVIKTSAENDAHVYPACVITSTNCIATYSLTQAEDDPTHVLISGVVLSSNDDDLLKIDVSGETWDK